MTPPTPLPDPLWWMLQRFPADQALRLALESRLREGMVPGGTCLPLESAGATGVPERVAGVPLTFCFSAETDTPFTADDLAPLVARIQPGDHLLLFLPSDEQSQSARALQHSLNDAGLYLQRWQRYYRHNGAATARTLANPLAAWRHALTGHYVLRPWRSALAPQEALLRPHYDADATSPSESRTRVCALCTFVSAEALIQEPVAAQPLPVPAAPPTPPTAPRAPAPPAPVPHRQAGVRVSADHRRVIGLIAIAAALAGALLAHLIWRSDPARPAAALPPLLLALAGMVGVRLLTRPASGKGGRTLWRHTSWPLPRARLKQGGLLAGGLALSLLAAVTQPGIGVGLLLWLSAIGLAGAALGGGELRHHWQPNRPKSPLLVGIAVLMAAAWLLRMWQVTRHPFMLLGIETRLGLDALLVNSPFGSAWLTHPILPLLPTRAAITLFGQNALALRLFSPLAGALTVGVIFVIGRKLWGDRVGLLAALLLAGNHMHLHYSRLGMSNSADALVILLAMGGLAVAWQRPRRLPWLAAGAAIGLGAYFYTAAHLLPLMLAGVGVWAIGLRGESLRPHIRHLAAAALLALVIALPQAWHYLDQPQLFMERANALGVVQTGWLAQTAQATGRTPAALWREQVGQAALAFNATVDRDGVYNPNRPIFGPVVGAFFLLGVGMAFFHLRQLRYTALLIGLLTGVIFGGALLLEPPYSRRLVVVLPLAVLLAARGAVWLGEKGVLIWRGQGADSATPTSTVTRLLLPLILLLGLGSAVADSAFYFGSYRQLNQTAPRFGDRNSEIAHVAGEWLASADPAQTVCFHAAPTLYANTPTLLWLAPHFVPGLNLLDVAESAEILPACTVHLLLPERAATLAALQGRNPGGTLTPLDGAYGRPLLLVWQ